MVDTGNVEQDVVQMDRSDIILLEKQGDYWEEIDYSLFDVDNIDEGRRYKYSVDMLPYATVIGYRNDVFPEGPQGQADFWNQDDVPRPAHDRSGDRRRDAVPRVRPHRRRRVEGRGLPDRHRPRLRDVLPAQAECRPSSGKRARSRRRC